LVGGRYRLIEPVGHGRMGRVWRGHDQLLNCEIAVKEVLLPPELLPAEHADLVARTVREARAAARLDHPGVTAIQDVVEHDGTPWIVLRFLPGRSLSAEIAAQGRLSWQRAAEIGAQVADALAYAHAAGVVHGGLNPDNILLGERGVLVADFGLAQVLNTGLTSAGARAATTPYTAPEQLEGGRVGPPADMWALGAALYATVEGTPPFTGPTLSALSAAIRTRPPAPCEHAGPLSGLIEALLSKEPGGRFSAWAVVAALRAHCASPGPVSAGHVGSPASPSAPIVRNQTEAFNPSPATARVPGATDPPAFPPAATGATPLLARRRLLGGIAVVGGALLGWGVVQVLTRGGGASPGPRVSSPPASTGAGTAPAARSSAGPAAGTSPAATKNGPPKAPGTMLWSVQSPGHMSGNVVVNAGVVYSADSTLTGGQNDHNVYAVNASSGQVTWKAVNYAEQYTGPAVGNGLVYFGSDYHTVSALSAATGHGVWQYTAGDVITTAPAVTGQAVYFASADNNVYSLDAATGKLIWQHVAGGGSTVLDVVAGDSYVYEAYGQGTTALSVSDGGAAWSSPGSSIVLAVTGTAVIVGGNGVCSSISAQTGAQQWSRNLSGNVTGMVVSGRVVYVASDAGQVSALSIADGSVGWTYRAGGTVKSGIAVANGVVYFGCEDHRVYAVDASAGHQKWTFKAGGTVESGLAVYQDRVFAGSSDGSLYALQA
jgi:outer membrane protein assembly factor BamB